jgi:ATP-dependent DNA helicase RecQ
METLANLHARGLLSLFAIDGAHCVSQWRPDFSLNIAADLLRTFPDVPPLALTATPTT